MIFENFLKKNLRNQKVSYIDDFSFLAEVSFEAIGEQTLLTMTTILKSETILDQLNREVNAIEGGKQTLNRLEVYVNGQLKDR